MKKIVKRIVTRYIPKRTFEELAIHSKVLFCTILPNAILPGRRRVLRRARSLKSLRLNIGCGGQNPPGWFGIDFLSPKADLRADIARGIPLNDESCACIFSEHVFEHFDRETLRRVLRECHRILEIGAPIRLIVPDLAAYIRAYIENDGVFSSRVYTTLAHYETYELMNEVFYHPTHRWLHDFASLRSELCAAGFVQIQQREQGESSFPFLLIDNPEEHRRAASLYVEAVKPPPDRF